MTHISTPVRGGLSTARQLLPWIAVLLVSATLGYALNAATAGGLSASDQQKGAQVSVPGAASSLCRLRYQPWQRIQGSHSHEVLRSKRWCTGVRAGSRLVDSRGEPPEFLCARGTITTWSTF
jgi:hypothetical protein